MASDGVGRRRGGVRSCRSISDRGPAETAETAAPSTACPACRRRPGTNRARGESPPNPTQPAAARDRVPPVCWPVWCLPRAVIRRARDDSLRARSLTIPATSAWDADKSGAIQPVHLPGSINLRAGELISSGPWRDAGMITPLPATDTPCGDQRHSAGGDSSSRPRRTHGHGHGYMAEPTSRMFRHRTEIDSADLRTQVHNRYHPTHRHTAEIPSMASARYDPRTQMQNRARLTDIET